MNKNCQCLICAADLHRPAAKTHEVVRTTEDCGIFELTVGNRDVCRRGYIHEECLGRYLYPLFKGEFTYERKGDGNDDLRK